MDTTLITAMSGVLGSLVGGSASVATTWVTQRTLTRRDLIREELRKRETLYGFRIGPGSRAGGTSAITEQYFSAHLSVEEMRELVRSDNADPLAAFGEACRLELQATRGRL